MKKIYIRLLFVLFALNISMAPCFAVSLPVSNEHGLPDAATVKQALSEFKSLSKKERKARFKQVKQAVRDFKAARKAEAPITENTLLMVILAILLPPLAVYLHEGTTTNRFWISVLLTLLFWLPGVIYALIVILE